MNSAKFEGLPVKTKNAFRSLLESILPEKEYEKLNYIAEDTMGTLTYLKTSDIIDKPTISRLIDDGELTERDLDKSALDLIASFYYKGDKTIARDISEEV